MNESPRHPMTLPQQTSPSHPAHRATPVRWLDAATPHFLPRLVWISRYGIHRDFEGVFLRHVQLLSW